MLFDLFFFILWPFAFFLSYHTHKGIVCVCVSAWIYKKMKNTKDESKITLKFCDGI